VGLCKGGGSAGIKGGLGWGVETSEKTVLASHEKKERGKQKIGSKIRRNAGWAAAKRHRNLMCKDKLNTVISNFLCERAEKKYNGDITSERRAWLRKKSGTA